VRKEAVLKAEGCGIGGSLKSFSVVRQHAASTEWVEQVRYPASGRTWRIVDLAPALDHLGALATPQGSIVCNWKPAATGVSEYLGFGNSAGSQFAMHCRTGDIL
jgi:hypothetical protein